MRQELKKFGSVKTNEPLARHTTFKIGGPADFFIAVNEKEKLIELLRFLDGEDTPYFILGGGSNMLARDEGYRGVAIQIRNQKFEIRNLKSEIVADAGCITVEIARQSFAAGLTGFEWGVGVPGSVGGAVRGNAGAMGFSMKDIVRAVEVYRDGEVLNLNNAECAFHYRDSIFKHNRDVALATTLALAPGENKEGMKKALEYLQYRNKTQPQGYASTGCIFKNIEVANLTPAARGRLEEMFSGDEKLARFFAIGKISAGWLVQEAGLKGERSGQALVSAEHGNFVVNLGGAASADVLSLVEKIRMAVYNKFGVELEEEIQIV